ncbi:MAG: ribonuclease HII [Thermosulfidibacteraceae bacterium]|jgi:ribonuclease HII
MEKNEVYRKILFDRRYLKKGLIAGVDEAGRGALAGPVVSAVVVFDIERIPEIDVDDSKKLNPLERERLYNIIIEKAIDVSVYPIGPSKIDELNVRRATALSMERAFSLLKVKPVVTLVDGDFKPFLSSITYNIVDGDAKSFVIASASIVAKVVRDRIMARYEKVFPGYSFSKNKGYGTNEHLEAIEELGITPIHRKSFFPVYVKQKSKRERGSYYEEMVCDFLRENGFEVIDRNFYTRFGEIDIVAKKEGFLYFVEVRGSSGVIDPVESLNFRKRKNLKKAISLYLSRVLHFNFPFKTLFISVTFDGGTPRFEILEDFIEN